MALSSLLRRLTTRRGISSCLVIGTSIVLAGCGGCGLPIVKEQGAEIVVDDVAEAGKPIPIAVYGQVGNGDKCPSSLEVAYKDADPLPTSGTVAEYETLQAQAKADADQRIREDAPQSAGAPCRLVAKPRQLTVLARGSQPRQVEISVMMKIEEADRIRRAYASKTVTITPPRGSAQVPVSAPAPSTQPPASSPSNPSPPATPQGPVARIVASREPLIEGDYVYLFGNASYPSHGGSIAKYEWDVDGDGEFGNDPGEDQDFVGYSQPAGTAGEQKTFRLRVTDSAGHQTEVAKTIPVVAASDTVQAYPAWPPHHVEVGESHVVKPQTNGFDTQANSAGLDWENDGVIDQELTEPPGNIDTDSFATRTYTQAGPQIQRIRLAQSVGSLNKVANYYVVTDVAPPPRVNVAAIGRRLVVSLNGGSASVKRKGRLRVEDNGFRMKGMRVAGRFRGRVPRGTPKALRPAFKTLASGRYVTALSGTASLLDNRVLTSGRATLLVRSAKHRGTQICLSIRQPAGGGLGRVKVTGATGRARGLRASGQTPPAILGPSGQPVFDRVIVRASKGRAKGLSRTCRSLARDLGGKRHKRR